MASADIMEMGSSGSPKKKIDPYVLAITIFTYACLAVAGTAVALYAEVGRPKIVTARRLLCTCMVNLSIQPGECLILAMICSMSQKPAAGCPKAETCCIERLGLVS